MSSSARSLDLAVPGADTSSQHLPIFLGPGTVKRHYFSGKSDYVFRTYAVPPAITRGTTGGILPDTNPVKGFVKRGLAPLQWDLYGLSLKTEHGCLCGRMRNGCACKNILSWEYSQK